MSEALAEDSLTDDGLTDDGLAGQIEALAATAADGDAPEAEAAHQQGLVAARDGRLDDAARLMRRSAEMAPDHQPYWRNLAEILRLLGRYDEALESGLRAAALDPGDSISHANLSVLHYERMEPAKAIARARQAVALAPDRPGGHFGLAEVLLLTGDLEQGWEEYEWRFRTAGAAPLMPDMGLPHWDGKPLGEGQLLLVADQGFGDGIQFARYIPWVRELCPQIVIAAAPEIQPLIAQLAPGVRLFSVWAETPACVAYCPLSGLPRLHATRMETIPAPVPYLAANPAKATAWRTRLDQLAAPHHRRVGLVWAGRPSHSNDRNRSTRLAALAPLLDLDDVTFVSLQKGAPVTQTAGYFGRAPLINLGPEIGDFADTLAILDGLDLLITVDTAVAHLAAAAGRPVWLMLPYAPDWRWLTERADSPWYPTMRLFRQPRPKAWGDLAEEVAAALDAARQS